MPGSAPAICITQQYVPGLCHRYAGDLKATPAKRCDRRERPAPITTHLGEAPMISILIALIVLAILAGFLLVLSEEIPSSFCFVIGAIAAILSAMGLISYAFTGWNYMAAEYKADILNREYDTNYTQRSEEHTSELQSRPHL